MFSFLPLKANEDVRETTRKWGELERSLMSSSEKPSLKYSCFGSPLMFTNGRTATDDSTGAVEGAGLIDQNCRAAIIATPDASSTESAMIPVVRPIQPDLARGRGNGRVAADCDAGGSADNARS